MTDKRPTRREFAKAGIAAGITAGFAGCTGGIAGGNGTDGSGGGSGSGGSGNQTVTLWGNAWDKDTAPSLVKHLKKTNPNNVQVTSVRYNQLKQKYLTGSSTGTPDVVEGIPSFRGAFYKANQMMKVTDRVNNLEYKDGYIGLDALTFQNDIWGLPYTGNGRGFVYRQDVFEKYGWEAPKRWDEFIEMASEITKSEDDMHGFALTTKKGNGRVPQEFLAMLFQRTDQIFTREGDGWKLNVTPEDLGLVFKNYYWAPFFATDPPASNPNARGMGSLEHDYAYLDGNYAALQTGPWIPSMINSDETSSNARKHYENSDVAHNPRIEGGKIGTFREIQLGLINPATEVPGASWSLLKNATSPEGIRLYLKDYPGDIPCHTDVKWQAPERTNNPDWAGFEDVFKKGTSYGFWNVTKLFPKLQDLVQQVIYDKTDPMDAGKELHQSWHSLEAEI